MPLPSPDAAAIAAATLAASYCERRPALTTPIDHEAALDQYVTAYRRFAEIVGGIDIYAQPDIHSELGAADE